MYLMMFVMSNNLGGFYNNPIMLYVTLMMVAPMVTLTVLAMGHMFPSKAANDTLLVGSADLLGCFALIRTQTRIGDREFLHSMIPHHSGAVLMCPEASVKSTRSTTASGRISTLSWST